MIPGTDIFNITAVLLADGWHEVLDYSFSIEPYDFFASPLEYDEDAEDFDLTIWDPEDFEMMHSGDDGFSFVTEHRGPAMLTGPMSSILAVQTRR